MRYEFLPPYSPDYNPIELAFSAIKAHIRRNGGLMRLAMQDDDDTDVYVKLNEAVWSVTSEDAYGWFHHCEYV
jgi:DDE superfamily endonuclease